MVVPGPGWERPGGSFFPVRILVVDDDLAVRRSIDRALRLEGYDVVTVPSGGEALEALALTPPDALILDLGLPDVDGLTVCRRMRSAGDDTPVLMLTARDAVDDRSRGSTPGPTTTWSSRSPWRSCWPGCAPCCGGASRARAACSASATSP